MTDGTQESRTDRKQAGKTWRQILEDGKRTLKESGIAEYDLDAWYLFEKAFHMDKARFLMDASGKAEPAEAELAEYEAMLKKRASRMPLQHILGSQEFMGMEFRVSCHVLIPRQDTETLVETVLQENRDRDKEVLDMCTGSGCIAVSLAALGKYRHVDAADISEEALLVAEENGKQLPENQRVRFRRSDLFSAFLPEETYDIIVSNPPYIPTAVIDGLEPEVRDFEPRRALDGEEDGLLFYRRLAEESTGHLRDGGRIYMEIGYDQGEEVSRIFAGRGFDHIRVIQDLTGKDRVVCGTWHSRQTAGEKRQEV